ncbi:hypothetical protein LTR62_005254 [Meristemomyces frigidus]|uniref:Uncharacterized protein n=1 Tax=Meristemomyces frigidus TaxID=1508187 RepID=A0AAN7YFL0_9PEZI|nr:hypothetical protein LTR62_005254 [Meristemomyces frigidus]
MDHDIFQQLLASGGDTGTLSSTASTPAPTSGNRGQLRGKSQSQARPQQLQQLQRSARSRGSMQPSMNMPSMSMVPPHQTRGAQGVSGPQAMMNNSVPGNSSAEQLKAAYAQAIEYNLAELWDGDSRSCIRAQRAGAQCIAKINDLIDREGEAARPEILRKIRALDVDPRQVGLSDSSGGSSSRFGGELSTFPGYGAGFGAGYGGFGSGYGGLGY